MSKNLSGYFKDVFKSELDAVSATFSTLPLTEIDRTIELILNRSGGLIITGLGKSGLIARKLAATFSSLGTKAFFLHAAEALHGDLGVLESEDLIIAISHSGETDELLRLLSFAKINNNSIIAITGHRNSTLARLADTSISYEIEAEACHLNLAPTSSTTIQLMIGDALAVTLAKEKGFKAEDFSRLHPAGSLGKRLVLRVKDVMLTDVPKLVVTSTLHDAVIAMTSKRSGVAVVVNPDQTLAGVLTDGDLRRALLKHRRNIELVLVSDICSVHPQTITIDENLDQVMQKLQLKDITSLVVIDEGGRAIGIVSMQDIERAVSG